LTEVQNNIRAVAIESCQSLGVGDKLFGILNQPMDRVDCLWVDGPACWREVESIPRARRRNGDTVTNSQKIEQKDNKPAIHGELVLQSCPQLRVLYQFEEKKNGAVQNLQMVVMKWRI
jgi:hypothetical protein